MATPQAKAQPVATVHIVTNLETGDVRAFSDQPVVVYHAEASTYSGVPPSEIQLEEEDLRTPVDVEVVPDSDQRLQMVISTIRELLEVE